MRRRLRQPHAEPKPRITARVCFGQRPGVSAARAATPPANTAPLRAEPLASGVARWSRAARSTRAARLACGRSRGKLTAGAAKSTDERDFEFGLRAGKFAVGPQVQQGGRMSSGVDSARGCFRAGRCRAGRRRSLGSLGATRRKPALQTSCQRLSVTAVTAQLESRAFDDA